MIAGPHRFSAEGRHSVARTVRPQLGRSAVAGGAGRAVARCDRRPAVTLPGTCGGGLGGKDGRADQVAAGGQPGPSRDPQRGSAAVEPQAVAAGVLPRMPERQHDSFFRFSFERRLVHGWRWQRRARVDPRWPRSRRGRQARGDIRRRVQFGEPRKNTAIFGAEHDGRCGDGSDGTSELAPRATAAVATGSKPPAGPRMFGDELVE